MIHLAKADDEALSVCGSGLGEPTDTNISVVTCARCLAEMLVATLEKIEDAVEYSDNCANRLRHLTREADWKERQNYG